MWGKAARPPFLHLCMLILASGLLFGARAEPVKAMMIGPSVLDGVSAFHSNGSQVRVDMFVPRDQEHPLPAVVLLHGASGVGDGYLIYAMAERLAETGLAVFAVHYFDAIKQGNRAGIGRYYLRDEVIGDAIDYVSSLHFIDRNRVGLMGYSLGAFQALERATRDGRVRAVVALAGGMDGRRAREGLDSMPPTLLLHGNRDGIVPVNRAMQAAQLLEAAGAPYEIEISNGVSHVPRGEVFDQWMQRAASFFHENLATRGAPSETVLLRTPGRR